MTNPDCASAVESVNRSTFENGRDPPGLCANCGASRMEHLDRTCAEIREETMPGCNREAGAVEYATPTRQELQDLAHQLRCDKNDGAAHVVLRASDALTELQHRSRWRCMSTLPMVNGEPRHGEFLIRFKQPATYRRAERVRVVVAHWMPGGHCIEDHPPIARGWYYDNGGEVIQFATETPMDWAPLPEEVP